MGEHADDCLDRMLDVDFDSDYGFDGFCNVMYDNETGAFEGPGMQQPKRCRYCGKSGLRWDSIDGRWRLHESDGDVHVCHQYFDRR